MARKRKDDEIIEELELSDDNDNIGNVKQESIEEKVISRIKKIARLYYPQCLIYAKQKINGEIITAVVTPAEVQAIDEIIEEVSR